MIIYIYIYIYTRVTQKVLSVTQKEGPLVNSFCGNNFYKTKKTNSDFSLNFYYGETHSMLRDEGQI